MFLASTPHKQITLIAMAADTTKLQVNPSEETTLGDSSSQNIRNYQKDGPGAGELVIVVTYLAMSLGQCWK